MTNGLPYPTIRQIDDSSHGRAVFELVEDFVLRLDVGKFGELAVYIPKGTLTDFASVPRALTWLVNPMDHEVVVGALLHDSLYATGFSRVNADNLLRFVMVAYGSSWWKQIRVYYAVRCFGWLAWPSKGIRRQEIVLSKGESR